MTPETKAFTETLMGIMAVSPSHILQERAHATVMW